MNFLTKKALKGDLASAREVISLLWSYRAVPQAKYVAYALVYQIALNKWSRVAEICMQCGGRCCREGPPIPIYDFDIEELRAKYPHALELLSRVGNDNYVLPRPCPLQRGWRCSIHDAKPYACLSYPFMVEEFAVPAISRQLDKEVVEVEAVNRCPASLEVKNLVDGVRERLRRELGRDPKPMELLEEIARLF